MQTAALLLFSAVAAIAQPVEPTSTTSADSTLVERAAPKESCTALWDDGDQRGYTCAKSGYVSYPDFLGAVDVSSAQYAIDGCITECERNPDCLSFSLENSNKLCSLWGQSLYSMGFQEEDGDNNVWGDRQCWIFSGSRCDVHSGNFEPAIGVPQINGLIHPWSAQDTVSKYGGTNFTFVKSGSTEAKPVPKSPYGQNFAKATVRDFNNVAAISQYIYPDPSKVYTLSFAYNFASFKQLSGTLKPKHYLIEVLYCGATVHSLELPLSKVDKKWKTHSITTKPTCASETKFLVQVKSEEIDSTDPGLFEAVIALDNVRFVPH